MRTISDREKIRAFCDTLLALTAKFPEMSDPDTKRLFDSFADNYKTLINNLDTDARKLK